MTIKHQIFTGLAAVVLATFLGWAAQAQQHPLDKTKTVVDYLEPAIPHPQQEQAAKLKLDALKKQANQKPNILIFIVDDMGWGDIGLNGGGEAVGAPTPNIDKLGNSGINLTSAYSQPTCTPTRAAIMTGRIPVRSGLTRPTLTGENPKINTWETENTAAKILSSNGYKTALSGKWHLGELEGTRPNNVGYDEYYGLLSVVSDMSQVLDTAIYPELINKPQQLAVIKKLVEPAIWSGKKGQPSKIEKHITSTKQLATLDQDFADYSEKFIRARAKNKEPFYLMHSFSRLHNDNYPAPGYRGKSPAGTPYKDGVVEVDDIVGRIMKVLKETGIEENTLVIFTSDNGANEDVWPDAGNNFFRGGKGTTWEGGVRVPTVAYWKGMIAPGRRSDGLVDLCDFFNTALAVGGVEDKIPTTNYVDGINQLSFLLDDKGESNRQTVFMYSQSQIVALRFQEYKVHFKVFQTSIIRQNIDESNLVDVGLAPWVFNLYTDPKEQRSSGHRYFEWGMPYAAYLLGKHLNTFKKYPAKDLGLGIKLDAND
jgi:arylsulfatase A-like enzyme